MADRPSSFDARVMAYLPMLKRMANRYPHVMEAEELVQNTVLYVLEKWENFRGDHSQPGSGFVAWMRDCMRSVASNYRRKQGGRAKLIPIAADVDGRLLAGAATPATQEDAAEIALALRTLKRMPHGEDFLRHAAGESQASIGRDHGLCHQAINLRIEQVRRDLQAGRVRRPYNPAKAGTLRRMAA